MRKYDLNENYFKVLDTPEKAYVLGFLYADGCVSISGSNHVNIAQLSERKDILLKIRDCLGSNAELRLRKNAKNEIYVVDFHSKILCEDLIKLGCVPNKSLILQFPNFIPDNLMNHFIRGVFDGDGCIWNGKRKKMTVRDKSRKSGFRERIVHNVKFTFTGNVDFITGLQDYLVNKGIVNKKTKLNFSKAKNPNNNTSDKVCTMEYSGRGQVKKLFDFMYKDATIYCDSKYNKFQEIFCALDEKSSSETGLIAGTPEMEISSQVSSSKEGEGSSTIPEMEVESSDSKCPALNE